MADMHSLLKLKHVEENINFLNPIRIEDAAIRCGVRWKYRNTLIRYVTANDGFVSRNMQQRLSYKKPTLRRVTGIACCD